MKKVEESDAVSILDFFKDLPDPRSHSRSRAENFMGNSHGADIAGPSVENVMSSLSIRTVHPPLPFIVSANSLANIRHLAAATFASMSWR